MERQVTRLGAAIGAAMGFLLLALPASAEPYWQSLGKIDSAGWAYAPTSVFRASGRYVDVFAVSRAGRVYTRTKQESSSYWTPWTEVPGGGILNEAPSATTWDGVNVDLCGRGLDNHLFCTSSTNGRWSGGWRRFNTGAVGSGVAAIRKGASELHLFAVVWIRPNGVAQTRLGHWVTNGVNIIRSELIDPPRSIGLGSYTPTVCLRSALGLEVFVTGSTGATFWSSWADSWGAWSVWENLGGVTYNSPSATCYGGHHLWVSVTGTNQRIYTRKHLNWYHFTPWELENQGGWLRSSPNLLSRGDRIVDVFGYGGDSALYWRTF